MPKDPAPWTVGDYITWPGVEQDCYRIAAVERFSISCEARDGYTQTVFDNAGLSLAAATADWIPATPEQIARHERLYRPAPQNWD